MKWLLIPIAVAIFVITPPSNFPTGEPVEIQRGQSVALTLREAHVIRYKWPFQILARITGKDRTLRSGRYLFATSLTAPSVLSRVSKGDYGTNARKVTVPEGFNNKQIGRLFNQEWDETDQGYLFPDTYFFDQFATPMEIRDIMKENFLNKVKITISYDDLIMASIIEEEASSTQDRRIVSGILGKRLRAGMPLQVDVATSTYKEKGLPRLPITNPGLDSIDAVRHPINSQYWYYYSDSNSTMYYARTFEEHKKNISRYP